MTKKLTFEEAKKMSIWRWKNFPTGYPHTYSWEESEFDIIPTSQCGFCEYYKRCDACPLEWKNPRNEKNSEYKKGVSRPCMREFWHWLYWYERDNKERMKYWAKRILKKIEEAKEVKK